MYRTSHFRYIKLPPMLWRLQMVFLFLAMVAGTPHVFGQGTFNSGSTGADGALSPSTNLTLQIPESGVFNFTTVNIPSGVTLKFTQNSQNTPVTILATGNVTITGSISVDGEIGLSSGVGGKGGPGGFKGGDGGLLIDSLNGKRGDGPGGGSGGGSTTTSTGSPGGGGGFGTAGGNGTGSVSPNGIGGPTYGSLSLLPLVGGSGGGGSGAGTTYRGASGGGGGGAILIASSGTITVAGSVTARAGMGGYSGGYGSSGSGGAVRLIASTLVGTGLIDVTSSVSGGGAGGGRGYVRAETYNYSAFNPNTYSVPMNITMPNPITVPNAAQTADLIDCRGAGPHPAKRIVIRKSGSSSSGSLPNPVEIQIAATNVPLDSIVTVTVTPPTGARTTFQSTPLAGAVSTSTATASVNLPLGMCVITASLTVDLQVAKLNPMFINGDKVVNMEIASTVGGKSETTFITKAGKHISLTELVQ